MNELTKSIAKAIRHALRDRCNLGQAAREVAGEHLDLIYPAALLVAEKRTRVPEVLADFLEAWKPLELVKAELVQDLAEARERLRNAGNIDTLANASEALRFHAQALANFHQLDIDPGDVAAIEDAERRVLEGLA